MVGDINVDLGSLSKPATVLIEKISDAVGGICKPLQTVREAKANAKADLIKIGSQIEINDLQRSALDRLPNEETKFQKNMEDIIGQALPEVNAKATPEKVDDDWVVNFFDKCRLISDSQMQSLWSLILAGEANSPNTFSKRTVNCLSSLDKTDADFFTNLCRFCGEIPLGYMLPLIYDYEHEVYNKHEINFTTLSHLESIGLIHFNLHTSFTLLKIPKTVDMCYYLKPIQLEFPKNSENVFKHGHVNFTKIGHELAGVCGSAHSEEFYKYILGTWKDMTIIGTDNRDSDRLL